MTERIQQIKQWLQEDLKLSLESFAPASSDASFRRYFRVKFSASANKEIAIYQTYIVMDAPPHKESLEPFIKIADYFESLGLQVPHVYAVNIEAGFLLLSDLGKTAYLDVLSPETVEHLYQDAFKALIKLQSAPIDKNNRLIELPEYSQPLLQQEMQLLEDWFIKVHLKYQLSASQQQTLQRTLDYLLEEVGKQPQVIVHRDYHSRNLMQLGDNNPGIIDFQDAVFGPCTYDLVSLLNDSYIAWPESQLDAWIVNFQALLLEQRIIVEKDPVKFRQWFDFMAMQRQIKVLGIFCRLYHRDGKENYLKDLPQTMTYLLRNSQKYEQFEDFYQMMFELNQHLETAL